MADSSLSREQILSLLAEAPQHIAAATEGLTPVQLRARPAPEAWSANEVLAHLRACADMWGGSLRATLAADHPTLRAINPRTWIKQTDYRQQEFRPSLEAFAAQRAELLAFLDRLSPADWERTATVTGAGRPLERSVYSYAHRLVIHERPHRKQIAQLAQTLRLK